MRPPAQKIHPMGFSGRREATKAPTVVNVRASKGRRTMKPRLGKIRSEALRNPNPSTPPPKVANGKENAHMDHAIHMAVRCLIPPTTRSCSLAPSVTTPLYSTIVSQALRNALRGRHVGRTYEHCFAESVGCSDQQGWSTPSLHVPSRKVLP